MVQKKSRRPSSTTSWIPRRTERCTSCSGPLRWRKSSSARPHPVPDFGFPLNVVGLDVAACSRCRAEHAVVANLDRFRRTVVEEILAKPGPLSSQEIRFLRKTLGLTGGQFAGLVGVSREHVSHIEQGHAPNLGPAADRLARLMMAAKTDPSLKLMKRLLASLDEHIGTRSRRKEPRHRGYTTNLVTRRN